MKKIFSAIIITLFMQVNLFAALSVTPAKSEIVMEAGTSYRASYYIENGYDKGVDVTITTKNWNNSPENKDVNAGQWLAVEQSSVFLSPHEGKEIFYTVKSGNFKGSLSGMISFTIKSPGHEGLNIMVSVPVYMIISGTENVQFEIDKLEISSHRDSSMKKTKNAVVNFSVKNTGNVYLRLSGTMKVLKGRKTVQEKEIPEQSPVYSGLSRSFYELTDELQPGKYTLKMTLTGMNKAVERKLKFIIDKNGDISIKP